MLNLYQPTALTILRDPRLTCLQLSSSQSTSFCVAIPIFKSSAYEICPAVKLSSLAMAPRVVDLAAPFRPSRQKISPCTHCQVKLSS